MLTDDSEDHAGLLAHKNLVMMPRHHAHRIGCVDFHISLRKWAHVAGAAVDFFHADYDPVTGGGPGKPPRKKTYTTLRRGALIPDAIFAVTDRRGVRHLYAFEYYRNLKTARVVEQLEPYLVAFEETALEKTYGHDKAVRVLWVFDTPDNAEYAKQRLRSNLAFKEDRQSFFCAAERDTNERVEKGWRYFDGVPATPFPQ